MRRLVLILLVVVVVAGGLAWSNRAALVEVARLEVQHELERASGQKAVVRSLRISLVPPRMQAEGISVGNGEPLARLDRVDIRLATLASVAEARLVTTITAQSLYFDATRLPESPESDDELIPPIFRIGGMKVDGLQIRFPIGDEVGLLSAATLHGQLESSRLRRLVSGALHLKGAELQRADRALDLGEIRASGFLAADGVTIQSASLSAPGRRVELIGLSPTRHEFTAQLDLHDLVILDDDFDPFTGAGQVSGELVGVLVAPRMEGSIEIADVRVAGRDLGVLTSRVYHEGETTRFEKAHLRGDAGEVEGTIVAKFRQEIPVEGTLTWSVSDVETFLNKLDVALSFDNQLVATTIVKGQFDPLQLDVSAEGKVLAGADAASVRAGARIAEDGTRVEFSLTQSNRTHLSGRVAARDGVLDGAIDLETSDLRALGAVAPRAVVGLDLSGSGTGTLTIGGLTSAPRVEGSLAATPLTVAGVDLDGLQARFVWTEDALDVSRATLEAHGGSASLAGKVGLADAIPNDWSLELTNVDTDLATGVLRRFADVPDIVGGGAITGLVVCSGPWSDPGLNVSLAVDNPRVAGEEFARLEVDGERGAAGWRFDLQATHTTEVRFNVNGAASRGASPHVSITATPMDLSDVGVAKRLGIAGVMNLEGRLAGDPQQADGELELSVTGFAVGKEEIGELTVRATGQQGMWRVEGEAPAKRLSIDATAVGQPPFAYTARLGWQDFALDYGTSENQRLTGSTTGVAEASGNLQDPLSSKASLYVSGLDLAWGDAVVGLETPIVLTGTVGGFRVEPFSVVGKETNLNIAGSFLNQAKLEIALNGEANLEYLELLGRPFVSSDGTTDIDIRLRHTDELGWSAEGTALVRRAVLDIGLPVSFTNATGTVVADGRVLEIRQLVAQSGGGTVRLNGPVNLDHGPALEWEVSNVAVNPEPGVEAVVSGEGAVEGTWSKLLVWGDVDVNSGLYSRDLEIVDIPALFRPNIEDVAESSPSTIVQFDLKTVGRGGLYIDNNVAQVEVAVDGTLRGTAQDPRLLGSATIVGGEVKVRRRTFTLAGGAADFRGRVPPNPNLNINAETEISTRDADYIVTATVSGTAQDPVVNFGSDDPSLTQGDIVSLVAVGRTAAQLQGESGGGATIGALGLVPTAEVEEQLSEWVGIDRFEVDLAQTDSQGDLSPGVTIGKNLTDRFRAALTTTFSVEARNAVRLEYDLTRRISLIGQWEADTKSNAGAFGGGVRMRYEFRRLPFSLLQRRAKRLWQDED